MDESVMKTAVSSSWTWTLRDSSRGQREKGFFFFW